MILEVVADTRETGAHVDPRRLGVLAPPAAGQLEQLWRVDRPAGEDDLAALDPLRAPAAPLDVDRHGATAVEDDARHERPRPDGEVLSAADRPQIRLGGAQTAAAVDVAIEGREALLSIPVDVLCALVARLNACLEEGPEQRVGRRTAFHDKRAVVTAPGVVRGSGETGLHLLEVRQAVGVVPRLHPGVGRPALVIERVAALEDLPVDARRSAEDTAAGVVDAPATHERLRLRPVAPVVVPTADR